jgi:hypothetical protein
MSIEADLKIRARLEERIAKLTPDGWAQLGLDALRYLIDHHERHFPGDPVAALANIAVVAENYRRRASQCP